MRLPVRVIVAATAVCAVLLSAATPPSHRVADAAAAPCGLSAPAFCDLLNLPAGNGNRSGQLDGTVWGVSRTTQDSNIGQGRLDNWAPATLTGCPGAPLALPDEDHAICKGQLVEATNDHGNYAVNAAYPKQPFDFAGRTGIVTFDVDLSTSGPHGAWPEFAITDKPTPAPHHNATTQSAYAQNAVGFSLAHTCGAGTTCGGSCPFPDPSGITVDQIYQVVDYHYTAVHLHLDGCVQAQPGVRNHFEVHLSTTGITIYATQPGEGRLTAIADAPLSLGFSRGLIWIEDVHYNAAKFGGPADYAFTWANIGFDGPVLPRDLAYDVPDSLVASRDGTVQLGYAIGPAGRSFTLDGVAPPSSATAALLTLNWFATDKGPISYSVNGHAAHTFIWPFDAETYTWRTAALAVPLDELHAGSNTVTLGFDTVTDVANIDLILVGAGAKPGAPPAGR
jgi:hypothetical protein